MKIRIKVKPEDFIVNEQIALPIRQKGNYRIYLLEKRNWNTVDLLIRLARQASIPLNQIGYGGKKDRYGLTRQYITTLRHIDLSLTDTHYSVQALGFCDQPMQPTMITGNQFSIAVRQLSSSDIQTAQKSIPEILEIGFANYFDDQRFGSFERHQGFLAEKLLKQQFNGALKIYLTGIHPEDSKSEKDRKRFFFDHWRDWTACLDAAATQSEKRAFTFLLGHPHDFLACLKQIPHETMSLYLSAYQSHLWNQLLRNLIMTISPSPWRTYPGTVTEYLYYTRIDPQRLSWLSSLQIPTYGQKVHYSDSSIKRIAYRVIEQEGLKPGSFNQLRIRQSY